MAKRLAICTLAADARGPLFDRAGQGLYQPGLVVQPFLMAAAIDAALDGTLGEKESGKAEFARSASATVGDVPVATVTSGATA